MKDGIVSYLSVNAPSIEHRAWRPSAGISWIEAVVCLPCKLQGVKEGITSVDTLIGVAPLYYYVY